MSNRIIAFFIIICCASGLYAQMPKRLTAYPAGKTAIVVCPGGSYSWLDKETEGRGVAQWLQSQGISAYVLHYRVQGVPSFVTRYRYLFRGRQYPDAQQDLQEAISWLRQNADSLGIDPQKIGAMGFSAGGHLVTCAGAQFRGDSRPNFVVAVYPVVTLSQEPYVHKRSRRALLGEYRKHSHRWRDSLSMEQQIPLDMPPTMVVNCLDDPIVHYHNSELLDSALTHQQVPHKYLQYKKGGHGFGADTLKAGPEAIAWKREFLNWLQYEQRI